MMTGCTQVTPEPVTFAIEMTEYAFTPDTIEVKVGQQVTVNLVNKGALEHEIMFGREVMTMNNLPNGYLVDMFETARTEPKVTLPEGGMGELESGEHGEGHQGFMVLLPKNGDEASMTFTVTKDMVGEWEMGCFELDGVHYTSGMVGKFIVLP
jgi:plastocyanin